MIAFLIVAYTGSGWDYLLNCINSIRNIYSDICIIVVNNHNDIIHPYLKNDINLRYFINEENSWELGGVRTGVYRNIDVTQFMIIQDGCSIINTIPFINDKKEIILFKTPIRNIAPALGIIQEWCKLYFPDIIYNDISGTICEGLMGFFSRDLLLQGFEYGLKYINVTDKPEAVASEGMFGLVLSKLCKNIEGYYDCNLAEFIGNKDTNQFLFKIALSRNVRIWSKVQTFYVPLNNIGHPDSPFQFIYDNNTYSSLNDCISKNVNTLHSNILLHYFKLNIAALLLFTEYHNTFFHNYFTIENDIYNISNLIGQNSHELYVIKHFNA